MAKFAENLQNLFRSKAFIIGLSVLIAIIAWIFVMDSQNPTVEENVTVNVSYENSKVPTANNLTKISGDEALSVKIKVSGRRDLVNKLSASDFSVSVDLTEVDKAGEYELDIKTPKCKKMGIKVVDYLPKTVSVAYDKQITKSVAVKIPDAEKYLAEGYELISVTTEPLNIPFSGFSSEIEDLDHIEIDLSSQITTIDENKHLTYFAKYISDTGVDISSKFDSEKIKVNIYVGKRVPIKYEIQGKAAQDCYLDNVTLSVRDVLLSATDDIYSKELKKLEAVNLGSLDISGKSAAFDEKFDVLSIVGDHFEIADESTGEVRVSVLISQKEVRSFKILRSNVKFLDKNEDLEYEVDDTPLKITQDQKFVIKLKAKPTDFDTFDETSIDISLSYPQEVCEKQIHKLAIKLPENIEVAGEYFVYITAAEKQIEPKVTPDEEDNPGENNLPEETKAPEMPQ